MKSGNLVNENRNADAFTKKGEEAGEGCDSSAPDSVADIATCSCTPTLETNRPEDGRSACGRECNINLATDGGGRTND